MIKLLVNNKRQIELSQQQTDGTINVDVISSKGEVDYYYEISAGDMTMLLNYYQDRKNKGLEVF
jgi:hypothetical protein